jgi:hypothetical protein
MVELVIRPSGNDAALIERLHRDVTLAVPHRLVVDAHTATKHPRFAQTARKAGVAFQVDPQTFYLQDYQHAGDEWARLPFANPAVLTPADFTPQRMDRLVQASLEFQISRGATALIAPYVHIESRDDGWATVQRRLYTRSRMFLTAHSIQLPLAGVIDVGWRLLDRTSWPRVLHPLLSSLRQADVAEIALAASRVDQGMHPEHR